MITSEVKTANKKFRIYRPDITLEDICRINGPAIVRKMIPCFDEFPDIVRDDVYESQLITQGKNKGAYKKVFIKGNNEFVSPKFSFVYGVNVRTPRVNSILPFSTTYVFDKKTQKGKLMDKDAAFHKKLGGIDYKVPDFTDEYRIRELLVYASVKQCDSGGYINAEDIIILSLTTEEEIDLNKLKKALCLPNGFFLKQINALGIQERAYMWLTSEDYNVNHAGSALSNIIAISDDYDAIAKYIKPRKLEFLDLLFLIKARHLFDTEIAQRKTAIASAKAAIMSRNMSHNLGSHVMAYLKQHLNSVQDMVRDNVLASLFSPQDILTPEGLSDWYERYKNKAIKEKEIALPFLVGLGKFISYLQERQDFIATIATDYVPYSSTVNFKDFIYDELNPDLRYERHKDRIGLQPDNILLGNIAKSEGLARTTNPTINKQMANIVIKYRKFNGKPVKDKDPRKKDLDDMRDFMIQLPGGVVGRQAIFSIVENVIRNAAKHGKWNEGGNNDLELTFDRFYLEDFKKGLIKDDFVPEGEYPFQEFFRKYYACADDINDLCVVTLTDNTPFEKAGVPGRLCKKLKSIRNALKEAYIDNNSVQMLQTNKGIKEMRISAAWIRGIEDNVKINPLYITQDFDRIPEKKKDKEDHWIRVNPERPLRPNAPGPDATPAEKDKYLQQMVKYEAELAQFRDDRKKFVYKYWKNGQWVNHAPILMVRACSDKPNSDFHLQYIFCLPRPKHVAIVLSTEYVSSLVEENRFAMIRDWYIQNSWGLFSPEDFIKTRNKSYEFVVLADDICEETINIIRTISPNRVFTQAEIKDVFTIDDALLSTSYNDFSEVLLGLYKYLCHYEAGVDIIAINDDKVKNASVDKPEDVIIQEGLYDAKYLYRKHNETETKFTEYLRHAVPRNCFVEGITGDNSTDRLVRNDHIDQLWLYKHLHAMKTTVGIFDERLFSKVFKKDESDIRLTKLPFAELKIQLGELVDDDMRQRIREASTEEELSIAYGQNVREVLGDYISIAFEKKGVSVMNLLKTETGLEIYGFDDIVWDAKGEHCFGRISKVGDIDYRDNRFVITNPKNLQFDYQTIHQGLLDKVYEQFDIRHDAKAKHEFTKAFYEAFSKDKTYIVYKDELISDKGGNSQDAYFLPHLRIHSGRSKPSYTDMPQHQPFIQYAAIEHAVLDCKVSLVELLDFARYE